MIGYVVLLIFSAQMTLLVTARTKLPLRFLALWMRCRFIFSGHTASGGDMNSLRIESTVSARPRRWIHLRLRFMPDTAQRDPLQYPIYGGQLAGLGW